MTNMIDKNRIEEPGRAKRPGLIRAWLACLTLAALAVWLHPVAFASHVLPPCEYEDSAWCYWDGRLMGDGTGWSFVALWHADPAPVTIYDRWIGPNMR